MIAPTECCDKLEFENFIFKVLKFSLEIQEQCSSIDGASRLTHSYTYVKQSSSNVQEHLKCSPSIILLNDARDMLH